MNSWAGSCLTALGAMARRSAMLKVEWAQSFSGGTGMYHEPHRRRDAEQYDISSALRLCVSAVQFILSIFGFANERTEHTLNHRFLGRNQVG